MSKLADAVQTFLTAWDAYSTELDEGRRCDAQIAANRALWAMRSALASPPETVPREELERMVVEYATVYADDDEGNHARWLPAHVKLMEMAARIRDAAAHPPVEASTSSWPAGAQQTAETPSPQGTAAHSFADSIEEVRWHSAQRDSEASALPAGHAEPGAVPPDVQRLDVLEALRMKAKEYGFAWDTWQFSTDRPIREQLDASLRERQAGDKG